MGGSFEITNRNYNSNTFSCDLPPPLSPIPPSSNLLSPPTPPPSPPIILDCETLARKVFIQKERPLVEKKSLWTVAQEMRLEWYKLRLEAGICTK